MKRSEINGSIRDAIRFARKQKFALPPFAYWSPKEWRSAGHDADEIRDCMLGWDVTDLGSGDFKTCGLVLFTIRNGRFGDPRYPKTYCEKMLIQAENQFTPMHFHWNKTEDIINRGGGKLVMQLYNCSKEEGLDTTDVKVSMDGVLRTFRAGDAVALARGESITLVHHVYHKFWAEEGPVLLGEVSMVNDDKKDNRFYEKMPRFPQVEEDEKPKYLLVTEYPPA